MAQEMVLIKSFLINRPNQIKLFDIKIPKLAQNIIGIEMGMRWINGLIPKHPVYNNKTNLLKINRNVLLGELKLQSFDKHSIFYAQELKLDQNFIQTDFSSLRFSPKPFTHQSKSYQEPIHVNANITVAQAIYKNQLQISTPYSYSVQVYIWVEGKIHPSTSSG
jgi:hypothetical protein